LEGEGQMIHRHAAKLIVVLSFSCSFFASSVYAAELLMFREHGCSWCEKWDEEIGEIYPKTTEGKAAPLRQLNIHDPIPEYVAKNGLVHFSPTFVLVDDGAEIGRITGYPGEDNFWWFLEELVKKM